jgi:hypothetical protein
VVAQTPPPGITTASVAITIANDDPNDTANPAFQHLITCQSQIDSLAPVHLPNP